MTTLSAVFFVRGSAQTPRYLGRVTAGGRNPAEIKKSGVVAASDFFLVQRTPDTPARRRRTQQRLGERHATRSTCYDCCRAPSPHSRYDLDRLWCPTHRRGRRHGSRGCGCNDRHDDWRNTPAPSYPPSSRRQPGWSFLGGCGRRDPRRCRRRGCRGRRGRAGRGCSACLRLDGKPLKKAPGPCGQRRR